MKLKGIYIKRALSYIVLAAVVLQAFIILASWVVAAAFPELKIRSLLSGEGVRWFLGHYVDNVASPLLVWIVLLSIAAGALCRSGLYAALRYPSQLGYRERIAIRLVLIELVCFILIVVLLIATPHAPLLNVSGHIYPSSFTVGIVPLMTLAVCLFAISYALSVGGKPSLDNIFAILYDGIQTAAPIIVAYILVVELYYSALFVFCFV